MKPYITEYENKVTNNVQDISKYLLHVSKTMGITSDSEPEELDVHLLSECGNYIAIYHSNRNAVGFYRIKDLGNTYRYSHLKDEEELEDIMFNIQKEKQISLLGDKLPKGDLIVYLNDGKVKLLKDSFINFVINNLDSDYSKVEKLVYTGISRGNKEVHDVDFVHDTIEVLASYAIEEV